MHTYQAASPGVHKSFTRLHCRASCRLVNAIEWALPFHVKHVEIKQFARANFLDAAGTQSQPQIVFEVGLTLSSAMIFPASPLRQ